MLKEFLGHQPINSHPPQNKNQPPVQIKTPLMTGLALQKSKIHPKYTVDKAPMQVDNSIKQVDNASLQRRFIKKQREQKPLQGGFAHKQGGYVSLQGCFWIKSGG